MKNIKLALLFVLLFASSAWANPEDFTVRSPDGQTFQLSQAKGKYVALHFLLKTECPYCLAHTRTYAARGPEVAGVVHVFLKPDSAQEIQQWAKGIEAADASPPTIYQDENGKLADAYEIPGGYEFHGQTIHYPALVLLDPAGKEVFRYVGKDNTDRYSFDRFTEKMKTLWAGEVAAQHLGDANLAVKGYDTVAYLVQNKALAGDKKITSLYRGAVYRFSSGEYRRLFAADPEKYAPQYGGWCATGIAHGDKIDIDPANYKITDGRLFLFYKGWLGNALTEWNHDEPRLTRQADENWPKIAEKQ